MLRTSARFLALLYLSIGGCLIVNAQLAERASRMSNVSDSTKAGNLEIQIERKGLWVVQLRVTNRSESEVTLSGLSLYLKRWKVGAASEIDAPASRQDYYAPVNLETRKALVLRKTTKGGGTPVPSFMKIAAQETAVVPIDMLDLKWGCVICANWPFQNIATAVEAGNYQLYAEAEQEGTDLVSKSNAVSFVKPAESGVKSKTRTHPAIRFPQPSTKNKSRSCDEQPLLRISGRRKLLGCASTLTTSPTRLRTRLIPVVTLNPYSGIF
jgi:hypothetical protein